ncbi:hypothetical protein SCRM01_002 [Synechococcus phage S-CRM01]|uniref:hypothetical protein n=1 Tax=Synechococcus phage S-CRM01 TaxID=1026955 RepID=UPI000209E32C|nr:hypothetical protein SCRM01_002 [Synechococcus phage S-CRM01]AEC52951.1 hypothetical protein SCRM01_002 [Synechococcus phage S-CRM01]
MTEGVPLTELAPLSSTDISGLEQSIFPSWGVEPRNPTTGTSQIYDKTESTNEQPYEKLYWT